MIMTVTYFVANRNSMYNNFAMVATSFFRHLISHRNLREIHRQAISAFYLFASGHSSNAQAYQGQMAPRAKSRLGARMFEPEFFGSKCTVVKKELGILLGLFGAPRSDLAPGELCPCPPSLRLWSNEIQRRNTYSL